MKNNIKTVLISKANLKKKIKTIAKDLSKQYIRKDLIVLALLDGAFVFVSDLVREMDIPLTLEFLKVKSYEGTVSSGRLVVAPDFDFKTLNNKHVLLVDDILDTGLTLDTLCRKIRNETEVLSVTTCVLLDKQITRNNSFVANYSCFNIPNEFVVGYGLDYNGKYRNLPYIGILKETIYG